MGSPSAWRSLVVRFPSEVDVRACIVVSVGGVEGMRCDRVLLSFPALGDTWRRSTRRHLVVDLDLDIGALSRRHLD